MTPEQLSKLNDALGSGLRQMMVAALEQAAVIAESHAICGCNGSHGACLIDDTPKAIASEIRLLKDSMAELSHG